MIAYFDTSALVPLVIDEPGTVQARSLWKTAHRLASTHLAYPEGRAALARAHRMGRLTADEHRGAVRQFDSLSERLDVIELDKVLVLRAGDLAELYGLRGFDAVHLAAAERLLDPSLILVTGDSELTRAARAVGIAVAVVS